MSDNQGLFGNYELLASQPDVQCLVCTRPFSLDTEVTDSFEALAICRECKSIVLNDNQRDVTTSTYRQRRQRRRASGNTSLESVEDTFSQQFSQLINLARQGHDADIDSQTVVRQQASYNSTASQSQRWHASDEESDGLSNVDSMFGEFESTVSFGDYGGDSDASLDQHSMVGREMVIQLDNESYMNTDTDIDPMNAAIDQWDSDDQEESELGEVVDVMHHHQRQSRDIDPVGLSGQESEDGAWTWSVTINVTDVRTDVQELVFWDADDPLDPREILLEQFSSRTGAPPAATSFVENLPSVVISTSHEKNGSVICPVCKDQIPIETTATQLPCTHLYHSSCILPWLDSRNTCPVCRYELPTDDPEYEMSKRATTDERNAHGVEHADPQEIAEEISDESHYVTNGTVEDTNAGEHDVHPPEQPNRAGGHSRWLFIAAAPVVTLVSLALVMCFTNPTNSISGRRQLYRRSQLTAPAQVDSKRSWWSLF